MKVVGCKIWYRTPGGAIEKKSGAWDDLPWDSIQVIVIYYDQEFAHGRVQRDLMYAQDFYLLDGDPGDQLSYSMTSEEMTPITASIKMGLTISDIEFQECLDEAIKEFVF